MKVATKIKTRITVNFHANTMNVYIDNIVLQLKNDIDNHQLSN